MPTAATSKRAGNFVSRTMKTSCVHCCLRNVQEPNAVVSSEGAHTRPDVAGGSASAGSKISGMMDSTRGLAPETRQTSTHSGGHDDTEHERSRPCRGGPRSEEHTSELQSRGHIVCRLLLEK